MVTRVLAEIAECSSVVARLATEGAERLDATAAAIRARHPRLIVFAGRGSSFNAGLYGRYLVETTLGLPVVMAASAVTSIYGKQPDLSDAVLLAMSQAGESPDTCSVVTAARESGALTVAITNQPASSLAAAAELAVPLLAGPEAVVVSKSYVAELFVVARLVARLSERADILAGLQVAHTAVADAFEAATRWVDRTPDLVDEIASHDRALVISRGYDLPTALDTALKLKEMGRVFADGFSAADLPHGHIVVATSDVPFIAIRPNGPAGVSVDATVMAAAEYGARPWTIGRSETERTDRTLVLTDGLPDELGPLPLIIPGYVLAERAARARGCDPDRPPGLQKVILTR
jgi:glucosamine--fructose-6-phosphate aminotransferase (isomerizing)